MRFLEVLRSGARRWAVVALLGVLAACSPSRGMKPGDTQVVAQWTTYNLTASTFTARIERATTEARIGWACGQLCFHDGGDLGRGAYNIYLYTADVPATVKLLIRLEQTRRLPRGLRIGIAKSKETYAPAYPSDLKAFALSYGRKPVP